LSNKDDYLRIGKIVGAHGLKGRLKIFVVTDIIQRFEAESRIYMEEKGSLRELRVADFRIIKGREASLNVLGVDDRDTALSLKGADIFIHKDQAEETRPFLGDGAFYYYDLLGCDVYLGDSLYGRVADILEAGGGDILVIQSMRGGEVLVPFVDGMVETNMISRGRITIHPVEGLIEAEPERQSSP
jgi:16S rRNA processing protein RimM